MLQKFSDAPVAVHEGCGGEVERLISAPSFQFKGTGWYVTDYGRNGKVPSPAGNGKHEGKTEGKSDGKSESKEGKSESKAESPKADVKPASTSSSSSSEK